MNKTILTAVIALTLLASATNLLADPAAGSPPFYCGNKAPCVVADCVTQTVTAFGYWSYHGATWQFHATNSWQGQTYDKTGSGSVFADAYTFPEKGTGSVDVSGVLKAGNMVVAFAATHCEL